MANMKSVFILSTLLGVIYGASVNNRKLPKECAQICPQIFSPVCASDGNELRFFSNDCELTAYNCQNLKVFQIMRAGQCDDQDLGFYLPVFGRPLGYTAPLQEENGVQLQDENEMLPLKNCKGCPRTYIPVCGIDGEEQRTFGNACMMDFTNCDESREFVLLKDGEC